MLNLAHNRIETLASGPKQPEHLPASLAPHLRELRLEQNQLRTIPEKGFFAPVSSAYEGHRLEVLSLEGNPLESLPQSLGGDVGVAMLALHNHYERNASTFLSVFNEFDKVPWAFCFV